MKTGVNQSSSIQRNISAISGDPHISFFSFDFFKESERVQQFQSKMFCSRCHNGVSIDVRSQIRGLKEKLEVFSVHIRMIPLHLTFRFESVTDDNMSAFQQALAASQVVSDSPFFDSVSQRLISLSSSSSSSSSPVVPPLLVVPTLEEHMALLTQLIDAVTQRTEIDQPLCVKCVDATIAELERKLQVWSLCFFFSCFGHVQIYYSFSSHLAGVEYDMKRHHDR